MAFDWGYIFVFTLRLLGFLVVATVVGLVLWPRAPAGRVGGDADAREWLVKRSALKTGAQVVVSEAAFNAYWAATLKLAPTNASETMADWKMKLDALNLAVQPKHMTVMVLTHWGPLDFTWAIKGVPKMVERHFVWEVQDGWLGHLKLPRAVAAWLAAHATGLAQRWPDERGLLEQLSGLALADGQLTLVTRPAERKH
ncbi:MAG: hypothetical protein EPN23_10480 [Verrucomicrobia bacterium]|nr:MAG: hypothetical protein EPN23_10480 [Verrucomicrobiota bacterium]